jgi:hypothetical protein
MADVTMCTPCTKGLCGDEGCDCLYEVQTVDGMVICDCDRADHLRCACCRRPLVSIGCEHAEMCAECVADFNCEDCTKEGME